TGTGTRTTGGDRANAADADGEQPPRRRTGRTDAAACANPIAARTSRTGGYLDGGGAAAGAASGSRTAGSRPAGAAGGPGRSPAGRGKPAASRSAPRTDR